MIAADGTDNKSKLGANAILAVSLAAAHAAARDRKMPLYRHLARGTRADLPVPMMNIINGGAHADNSVDIQEFMILPLGAPSLLGSGALRRRSLPRPEESAARQGPQHRGRRRRRLRARSCLRTRRRSTTILEAIDKAGYRAGKDIYLGLDVASTEFYKDGVYELESEGRKFNSSEFADYLAALVAKYPIVTIEDGMSEGDWDGWAVLTKKLGARCSSWATTCSSPTPRSSPKASRRRSPTRFSSSRIRSARLTETLAAIDMAAKAKYAAVVSHRSGETEDATIADIAVATTATQIKTGSMSRSDRIAKYNQLLRIEGELGAKASLPGRTHYRFQFLKSSC